MTLNLHSGGELVEYDTLRQLVTPPATPTHVPIEHHRLVDLMRGTLQISANGMPYKACPAPTGATRTISAGRPPSRAISMHPADRPFSAVALVTSADSFAVSKLRRAPI